MFNEKKSEDALNALLNVSDKIEFFKDLSKSEIESLITDVKIIKYKYGELIFNEGDTLGDELYYLIKGKISISKYMQGTTSVKTMVTVIDRPALFGEMMRFTSKPRSATVESLDNHTLVVAFRLHESIEDTPISRFYRNVIRELSEKINKMNDQYC